MCLWMATCALAHAVAVDLQGIVASRKSFWTRKSRLRACRPGELSPVRRCAVPKTS